MAQRITGVIYNSAPIVFLSISPTGGTALASVYAVYNNVFIMVKSLLHSFIDAPRLSFGQMLTERKRDEVWPVYAQYEYLAFFATFLLVTTCGALILPFISLYTGDLADAVNYYDLWIALFMIAIAALEMIHIPSGHLINMAGHFRVSRNIQVSSCAVLVVTMGVGGILWGIYGMLAAILLCAVLLCVTEMGYVHVKFFEGKLLSLFRLLAPFIVTGTVLCYFEMKLPLHFDNYLWFIVYGVGFVAVNGVAGLLVGLLFNRKELLPLIGRAVRLLKRK
jgi:O-antigen/teichoic acid export membrane protein